MPLFNDPSIGIPQLQHRILWKVSRSWRIAGYQNNLLWFALLNPAKVGKWDWGIDVHPWFDLSS